MSYDPICRYKNGRFAPQSSGCPGSSLEPFARTRTIGRIVKDVVSRAIGNGADDEAINAAIDAELQEFEAWEATDKMQQMIVVTNRLGDDAVIRRALYRGREHLVMPVVMIREQVLACENCEDGGEFVSFKELAKSVPMWEGRPITIEHPKLNGEAVSAGRREIAEHQYVGYVFNVRAEEPSLKGELWMDVAAMNQHWMGADALERLERGDVLEVSTGYFRDFDAKKGQTSAGATYGGMQTNIGPDHLALILRGEGACSVRDGCGTPRTNEGVVKRIATMIREALNLGGGQTNNGGTTPATEEVEMKDRKTRIAALAANTAVGMTEADLEKLTDAGLDAVEALAARPATPATPAAPAAPAENAKTGDCGCGGHGKEKPAQPATNAGGGVDIDALAAALMPRINAGIETATKPLADFVANQAAAAETERQAVVSRLAANTACPLDNDDLKDMGMAQLQKLEAKYGGPPANYAGLGGPRVNAGGDEMPDAPLPVLLAANPDTTKAGDKSAAN